LNPHCRMAIRLAFLCLAMVLTPNAWSQGFERFIDGVVEVEVRKRAGRPNESGTGFVVSTDHGTISVLTARHLFFEGKDSFTDNISVTLYLDKLHSHKAVLVTDSVNLDLAVLESFGVPSFVSQQLPTFSVRSPNTPLSIGEPLYVYGGKAQSWRVPLVTISGSKDGDRPDRFTFTGIGIRNGFSGAPLLDSSGRLVAVHLGLVESDESFGHAQRMTYAYGILSDLGVTMNKLDFADTTEVVKSPFTPQRKAGDARVNEKDGLSYRWIPPTPPEGFLMGCSPGDRCYSDETPHTVSLTKGFWMGEVEVTQGAYKEVMGGHKSSHDNGDDLPAKSVSWSEALAYCVSTGGLLPTEAQWEWAARAGTRGSTYGDLDKIAWYGANSGSKRHPAGQKDPNAWGLRDMLGNVREWVADWYAPYPRRSEVDPTGPPTPTQYRTLRGGSWINLASIMRVSYRDRYDARHLEDDIGFRCVE